MFPGAGLLAEAIWIFTLVLFVRALMSWLPGMSYTQIGRIVFVATEWYLAPIRRVIPPAGGLDLSFIVGLLILIALQAFLTSGSLIAAIIGVINWILVLLIILLLLRIAFAFFKMDPWHPITQMVVQSTEVFARPFRGFFPRPRYGQFDWAPVAAVVVLLVVWFLVNLIPRFTLV